MHLLWSSAAKCRLLQLVQIHIVRDGALGLLGALPKTRHLAQWQCMLQCQIWHALVRVIMMKQLHHLLFCLFLIASMSSFILILDNLDTSPPTSFFNSCRTFENILMFFIERNIIESTYIIRIAPHTCRVALRDIVQYVNISLLLHFSLLPLHPIGKLLLVSIRDRAPLRAGVGIDFCSFQLWYRHSFLYWLR